MKKEESTKKEESIKKLKDILEEATETDNSVCYVTSDDADVLKAAIQALEKESVLDKILDKIKAEIMEKDFDFGDYYDHTDSIIEIVCKVIDKYGQKPLIEANREQIDIENSIDNERKEGEIELVIRIPEEEYRWIKKSDKTVFADVASKECMLHAIKNGTPLPKGHGNLKDMGNLPYIFDLTRDDPIYSGTDIERAVNSMKSIIEADNKNKAKSATSYDSKEADTQNKEKEDFEEERDI